MIVRRCDWFRHRKNDLLRRHLLQRRNVGKIFRQRPSGHRHDVAMQKARAEQFLHHNRNAADRMQAAHRERAMRLQVGEQRNALADLLDAFDRDRHLRLARDREQMQIHVGRATHRIDGRYRVLERPLGHDVARPDAGLHQPVQGIDRGASLGADIGVDIAAGVVIGRMRGAARQHHADRFRDRAHGVGREHRAAGAAAGHHIALDFQKLLAGKAAGLVGGAGLGVIEDRDVVALAGPCAERDTARRAGAGIEHEPEGIGARQRHQRRRAGLVAAGNHDHGVAVMRVVADLKTVGDGVARGEAITRRRRALRQRIRDRRRADDQPLPAAFRQDIDQQIGDGAHAIVAAMGIGVGAGDRHHRAGLRGAIRIESGRAQFNPRALPIGAAVLRRHGVLQIF